MENWREELENRVKQNAIANKMKTSDAVINYFKHEFTELTDTYTSECMFEQVNDSYYFKIQENELYLKVIDDLITLYSREIINDEKAYLKIGELIKYGEIFCEVINKIPQKVDRNLIDRYFKKAFYDAKM